MTPVSQRDRLKRAVLLATIVVLASIAGVIHLSLGAPIFILNALGYFALAAAYIVVATVSHPLVARFSWLPRVALFGYAAASIVAWLVLGGFYWLGYLTKAIELALMVLVAVDIYLVYGGLQGLINQLRESLRWALAVVRR
jgi:hypothetical protein